MISFRLSFAEIIKHDPHLAEVIVDEGVVITMAMVKEYHRWIIQNLTAPSYLLINKINGYSYTRTAEQRIADLQQIKSIAVVNYDEKTKQATEQLKSNNHGSWKLRQFNNVHDAMTWLY